MLYRVDVVEVEVKVVMERPGREHGRGRGEACRA